ncbi:hypothetical protein PV04_10230 [Phialophora macrospora]|uniref:Uncharacterized protein n=1 Tax=Phialophora macrospora TaxID=1851006 RepID=A0A0D2CE54_9EURO|nr:hypothetical protein PV04_10230 [Phialophora macrospora]
MDGSASQHPQGQNNNQNGSQNNNGIDQQTDQERQLCGPISPVSNMWQHYQGQQQQLQRQHQHQPTLGDYMRGTWNNAAPHNQPYGAMNLQMRPVSLNHPHAAMNLPMTVATHNQPNSAMDLPMFAAAHNQPYGAIDLSMATATPADLLATPTRPAAGQHVFQASLTSASRGGNNALRPPRARAPVPSSDPPIRVAANYLFPQVPEQVGEGLASGRNWLVIRIGSQDPVLRAPLLIARCKRDPINQQIGTAYPTAEQIIPAGTSLQQVCQHFPRHVWGEMLRIFLSERWDARRIWDLLPPNMRNNSSSRPWNYLQAAMGREVDTMMQEDTGVRRVPLKKARTPTPAPEEGAAQLIRDSSMIRDDELINESDVVTDDEPPNDDEPFEGVDWNNEVAFTIRQLRELTRRYRQMAIHSQSALCSVKYGKYSMDHVTRFYKYRHNVYFRRIFEDYEHLNGPMPEGHAGEMLRLAWEFLNPRPPGMSPLRYRFFADWFAARNYAGAIQTIWEEIDEDYWKIVGKEGEGQVQAAVE